MTLTRRTFLSAAAVCGTVAVADAGSPAQPILDTHIHLFDPTRAGGVPWPKPGDLIYQPALPARYQALAAPFGIVGAIAIEASPRAADNDWLLRTAAASPFIVGIIGDLVPGDATFPSKLARLATSPLFLGIRYGNLWERSLAADLSKPGFVDDLQRLSDARLTLETANPDGPLIDAITRVGERLPGLRIVIDHLASAAVPADARARRTLDAQLRALGQRPHTFAKISEVPVRSASGELTEAPAFYRDRLASLWEDWGEDRLLFGSDWPNSDHVASFSETLRIVTTYLAGKSTEAQAKVYRGNARRAYRWQPRTPAQRAIY